MSEESKFYMAYPVWLWLLTNAFGAVLTAFWLSLSASPGSVDNAGSLILLSLLFGLMMSLPALLVVFLVHILMMGKTQNTTRARFVLWFVTVASILATCGALGAEFLGEFAVTYILGLSIAALILSPEKKAKRE